MKHIIKYLGISTIIFVLINSCDKKDSVPYYSGSVSVVTSTKDSVSLQTFDSSKIVLSLNWTKANNGSIDSTTRYILQIDSAGRNFSKAYSDTLFGKLSKSFTAPKLDSILLYNLGFSIYSDYKIEVRVISSYANNNNILVSKAITIRAKTFFAPAIVPPPTTGKLYIIGDATFGGSDSGWNNPVPVPSQQFTKIDSLTYVGTFYLHGGGSTSYLFLPLNGDWTHKYAVSNNTVFGLNKGGAFGYDYNDNFPGPDSSGNYQIKVDFLRGKFTVTKQ